MRKIKLTILGIVFAITFQACGGNGSSSSSEYDFWDYLAVEGNFTKIKDTYDINGSIVDSNDTDTYESILISDNVFKFNKDSNATLTKKSQTLIDFEPDDNTTTIFKRFINIGDNIVKSISEKNITLKGVFTKKYDYYNLEKSARNFENVIEIQFTEINKNEGDYDKWNIYLNKTYGIIGIINKNCDVNGTIEDNSTICNGTQTTSYYILQP